jgi:AcrR family transcriptional regulator
MRSANDNDNDRPRAVPPVIEMAWGLRTRPAKGPKRGLTLEGLVTAAIDLASADGLDAVSMSRVASKLGVSTMALYRYVSSKDDLVLLMLDGALGPSPGAHRHGLNWRSGLERWARAEHATYLRHPWALRVPMTTPPLGPNNIDWLDDALRCLADTKLTEQQKLSSVLLLSVFVRGASTLHTEMTPDPDGLPPPTYGTLLAQLVDSERFPALHLAITSGALDDDDGLETEFDFGLERILDGIEALVVVARRRKPTKPA